MCISSTAADWLHQHGGAVLKLGLLAFHSHIRNADISFVPNFSRLYIRFNYSNALSSGDGHLNDISCILLHFIVHSWNQDESLTRWYTCIDLQLMRSLRSYNATLCLLPDRIFNWQNLLWQVNLVPVFWTSTNRIYECADEFHEVLKAAKNRLRRSDRKDLRLEQPPACGVSLDECLVLHCNELYHVFCDARCKQRCEDYMIYLFHM